MNSIITVIKTVCLGDPHAPRTADSPPLYYILGIYPADVDCAGKFMALDADLGGIRPMTALDLVSEGIVDAAPTQLDAQLREALA